MSNQRTFATSDFYLAALLMANRLRIVELDRSNPRRVRFVFEDSPIRKCLVVEFLNSEATVNAQAFIAAIRHLKRILYAPVENENGDIDTG